MRKVLLGICLLFGTMICIGNAAVTGDVAEHSENSSGKSPIDMFEFARNETPAKILSSLDRKHGAALVFQSTEDVIQISGLDRLVVRYTVVDGAVVKADLPMLPEVFNNVSAAVVSGKLFVAGQVKGLALLKIDLSDVEAGWTECSVTNELNDSKVGLVGLHSKLYVTGAGDKGDMTFVYNPVRDEWKALAASTIDLRGYKGVACGNDHLLFFNANQPDNKITAYHKVLNSWFEFGQLPEMVVPLGAIPSGTEFSIILPKSVIVGKAILKPTKYGMIDHMVVVVFIIALVLIGLYFSNKEKSSGDFFKGGNHIPWWAAGLSMFASGASAISLMAMPGKSFADNWIYFSGTIYIILIQIPLMFFVYIPIIRRLNFSTANEYLEKRYGISVRMLGFVIYTLNQMLGRMAAILLLPSIAITAIFGVPMEQSILIMGVVSTIYVTLGGLEAVIWTDVLQAVVMLAAVIVCCLWAYSMIDMSAPVAMDTLSEMDKLMMFDFSTDWTSPVVLILMTTTLSVTLGMVGDQTFIQRVQCTPSEKESRKSILTQLAVAAPMNIVLFGLGTLLYLFYQAEPETLSPALKSDGIFPFFAAQNLPTGLAGFVVAAILAATMSTVSGAINSVANLGVEDIYRRYFSNVTDQKCLKLGRILTIALGIFGTVAALILAQSDLRSVWDIALMITGMILAPITGIFVLGIFTKRANTAGVWIGTIASIVANAYAKMSLNVHSMAFLVIGVFTCIIIGYLASFIFGKDDRNLDGMTVFSLAKK